MLQQGLQGQIGELDQKINQLHHIVERLSLQIAELTVGKQQTSGNGMAPLGVTNNGFSLNGFDYSSYLGTKEQHKDILPDESDVDVEGKGQGEHQLSPETQIRRLTAQLTAAYNRIAALEEQLLACRISS